METEYSNTPKSESQIYQPAHGQKELYPDSYFEKRVFNDTRRLKQFLLEGDLIRKYVPGGAVLDVGCSTGEFLTTIQWNGEKFGMEISDYARSLAEKAGIRFDKNLFTERRFFDCIIFRGVIQQLDEPFRFIKFANRALRSDGYIVFLATPNTNSPVYRLKGTLPFIDPTYNFLLPDDKTFPNALRNLGFEISEIRFPYLNSPYRNLIRDHWTFAKNVFFRKYYPHAFWRSSMEIVAKKVKEV